MTILELDPETLRITKECLRAAADGPFFPDWEFQTLIGVDRDTVRLVMDAWPARNVAPEEFACTVINSLTWLMIYPHGQAAAWDRYIPVGPERVRQALDRLRAAGL